MWTLGHPAEVTLKTESQNPQWVKEDPTTTRMSNHLCSWVNHTWDMELTRFPWQKPWALDRILAPNHPSAEAWWREYHGLSSPHCLRAWRGHSRGILICKFTKIFYVIMLGCHLKLGRSRTMTWKTEVNPPQKEKENCLLEMLLNYLKLQMLRSRSSSVKSDRFTLNIVQVWSRVTKNILTKTCFCKSLVWVIQGNVVIEILQWISSLSLCVIKMCCTVFL